MENVAVSHCGRVEEQHAHHYTDGCPAWPWQCVGMAVGTAGTVQDSQETQRARTAVEKPITARVKVSSEFPGFCVTVLHIIQTVDVFIVEDLSRRSEGRTASPALGGISWQRCTKHSHKKPGLRALGRRDALLPLWEFTTPPIEIQVSSAWKKLVGLLQQLRFFV